MFEFLQYAFMQRAFIAGIFVAVVCSVLGVFLVVKRLSMIGDGLAHITFGGLALGLLLGINPIISALAFAVLAALITYNLQSKIKLYGDVAIALMLATGLGIGVVLISLGKHFTADLFSLLFGSILTVTPFDLVLTVVLGLIVIIMITFYYNQLVFLCFDEDGAKAAGISTRKLNILLNVLAALTIVVAVRIIGIMLVSSLLVVPVAASLQIARSFTQTIRYAILFGIISVITGLIISFYFNLAAGGVIVLTSVLIFSITMTIRKLGK